MVPSRVPNVCLLRLTMGRPKQTDKQTNKQTNNYFLTKQTSKFHNILQNGHISHHYLLPQYLLCCTNVQQVFITMITDHRLLILQEPFFDCVQTFLREKKQTMSSFNILHLIFLHTVNECSLVPYCHFILISHSNSIQVENSVLRWGRQDAKKSHRSIITFPDYNS